MARNSNKAPAEAPAEEGTVSAIPADEVAELVAAQEENDLTRSGRTKTKVDTATVVEDRTEAPARLASGKVKVASRKLDNGTVLQSYT